MGCVEQLNYEILLSKARFKECSTFISSNYDEYYKIQPGYRMMNVFIIGVPPIYVAVDGDNIIFPYTKPCHGTFVLTISSPDEVKKIKTTGELVK